jgi:hypothetical protein
MLPLSVAAAADADDRDRTPVPGCSLCLKGIKRRPARRAGTHVHHAQRARERVVLPSSNTAAKRESTSKDDGCFLAIVVDDKKDSGGIARVFVAAVAADLSTRSTMTARGREREKRERESARTHSASAVICKKREERGEPEKDEFDVRER